MQQLESYTHARNFQRKKFKDPRVKKHLLGHALTSIKQNWKKEEWRDGWGLRDGWRPDGDEGCLAWRKMGHLRAFARMVDD